MVAVSQFSKEWASFKRDRLAMSLAIILPLATLILFGFGVRLESKNIELIVQDADRSTISARFIKEVESTGIVRICNVPSSVDVQMELLNNKGKGAIRIPKGFGGMVEKELSAPVGILIDGSDVSSAETLKAAIKAARFKVERDVLPTDWQSFFVIPEISLWYNHEEERFVVSGVFAIVLWMYPALLAAVSISRELEQGTVVQVYASGLRAFEYLVGKGMLFFLIGLVVAALMMIVSFFLFHLRLATNPLPVLLSTITYIVASVSFGLLIGVATKEENIAVQATATGGFFPALLLSGFVYPLSNIPFPLSVISYFVPARYYIEICRDAFLRGAGWNNVGWQAVVLVLMAAISFAAAWSSIRRMQVDCPS